MIVYEFCKKYWFMMSLIAVFIFTVSESGRFVADYGIWLKKKNGADVVIFLIFFLSGAVLKYKQIYHGVKDFKGTLTALGGIFIIAPIIAVVITMLPMEPAIMTGLILVASMPTTLSSGVVMTKSAGGNMAHALLITILSNLLAVFTIPFTLSLLLGSGNGQYNIDISAIILKISTVVLLPLILGMLLRAQFRRLLDDSAGKIQLANQLLIVCIVWMAVSQARGTIIGSWELVPQVFGLVFVFHGAVVACVAFMARALKIGPGRRESVIFMGGQKTLPLSVILQVTLFPQFGQVLVVCVMHHIVHLLMDSYLVGKLSKAKT